MDVGVYVDPRVDIAPIARAVEQAGFSHLWVPDSPLLFSDTTVAMTLALEATDSLVVGPGVFNPLQRPAPYTAQLAATLARLAPRRVVMAIGSGHSARRSLGQPPARIADLVTHLEAARRLARGETVAYPPGDADQGTRIRLLNPTGRWVDVSTDIPWWVSAFGPRTRAAAAAVADGIMVRWQDPERAAAVRKEIDEAARRAGRSPSEVQLGVLTAVVPAEPEEFDSDKVVEAVAPLVISRLRYLHANVDAIEEAPAALRPALSVYRELRSRIKGGPSDVEDFRGYLTSVPEEVRDVLSWEAMAGVAHIAPADEIVAEVGRMRDSGVDHLSLQIAGDLSWFARRMGEQVLPRILPAATSRPRAQE